VSEENVRPGKDPSPSAGPEESHRDRTIWWILAGVGVVVFIALMFLGRPLVSGRLSAARNLDKATTMIAATDGDFAAIDKAVLASVSSETPAGDESALAKIFAIRPKLEEAEQLSQTGYERLTEDEQRRAKLVKAVAAARLETLIPAETALSNGAAVQDQAIRDYEKAVEKARQADAALVKL
jgi:exonuclease VII small subunit